MTREHLREIALNGIDRALNHPILAGLTQEGRAVLLATRQLILTDDTVLDRIIVLMGPQFLNEGVTSMSDPKAALDWTTLLKAVSLLQKYGPAVYALIQQILDDLQKKEAMSASAPGCCDEEKCICIDHVMAAQVSALCQLIHLKHCCGG